MDKNDIRDLRVGNWVYSSFSETPCKVTEIRLDESGYGVCRVTCVDGYKDVASLSPIPLTKEILEKNSFSDCGVSISPQYIIEDGQIYIGVTLKKTPDRNEGVLLFNGKRSLEYDGKIEYVHQLQNLLRDLGIEKELTI